jgi:hypothetical protein
LLPHVRALLEQAGDRRNEVARLAGSEAVPLGYTNWLPPDLAVRASGVARLHIDTWVEPSHVQVARVADGSLDLAVCWVSTSELEEQDLNAQIIGVDRLYAVSCEARADDVRAEETFVLLDDDAMSWSTWNAYAEQFARDTGAQVVRIRDGGITGPAFFDHVRRARRPINSPRGQDAPLPQDLVRRPVVDPQLYWTWSLVWRRAEARSAVLAVIDAVTAGVVDFGIHAPGAWLPNSDPPPCRRPAPRLRGDGRPPGQ